MGDVIRCQGSQICSPFVDPDAQQSQTVLYVSAGTGQVLAYDAAKCAHSVVAASGGMPLAAGFDANRCMHVADCAHAAILRVDSSGLPGVLVKAYEDKPFRGPSSLAFGTNGAIYFTDSGPLGETTLEQPRGSIFFVGANPAGEQVLRPLAWECLAHPSAITGSRRDPDVFYVTELMANRVLRLVRRPPNTHHLSVFYQFSGGMGPSCVACDRHGTLYVGHFDFAGMDATAEGKVSVINPDGSLQRVLTIRGSEITGICLSPDDSALYITEASANALHRVPL